MPGLVVTEDTMNWKRGIIATVCMLMLSVTLAASDSWLHIRVEERGRGGENISVNIPLALVEALIPAIETEEFNRGRIHIGDADLDGIDLHEILLAVRDAPDADYVKVNVNGKEHTPPEISALVLRKLKEAAESYFNLQNYLVQSVVGALIMGLVTTLIVALFLRAR